MDAHRAGAIACTILSWIARLCAIALCILAIMLCFPSLVARLHLTEFILDISNALPSLIAGYGLIPSPFGGVFRFDFALSAALLFLIDYALQRAIFKLR